MYKASVSGAETEALVKVTLGDIGFCK